MNGKHCYRIILSLRANNRINRTWQFHCAPLPAGYAERKQCFDWRNFKNNMLSKRDVSAVIFDMDGLMFDTERIAIQTWQKAGATCGYDIPESLIIESIGRDTQDTQSLFENALGQDFDFQHVRKLRIHYAEEHIKQHGVPLKEGLYEVLDVLTTSSVLVAVATSTERARAETLLTGANVLDKFDVVICGDDVYKGKPAPDIFLLVAERLQTIPEQCLVLEDSESGIRAAVSAHMIPILIPDIKPPSEETLNLAYKVFSDLRGVASYLSHILQPNDS